MRCAFLPHKGTKRPCVALPDALKYLMPVLHVRALPQVDPSLVKPALKKTCLAIADICRCPPGQVWATWEEIRPGWYVEGTKSGTRQTLLTHPPICQLIGFEGKTSVEIEEILLVASKTLSAALNIGDNIYMTYLECKTGQVIAGNGIVRK